MAFDFEKCRSLFLDATLAELTTNKSTILRVPGFENGGLGFCRDITGICLDIAPWHRGFDLALRDRREAGDVQIRYSIGDWNLYPLRRDVDPPENPLRRAIEELFNQEYGALKDPERAREIAHLMFLAAAEALLDHEVTTSLRACQIDAPYIDDTFPSHHCFEYFVTDPDESIMANYCDIVIANRITNRLKLQL